MKTHEIVVSKVKSWLQAEERSYQWLANELGISKSMVGHMLSGKRVLQPHHMEQLASLMNIQLVELLQVERNERGPLTVCLRGNVSNRLSKRELDALLFAIEDYVGLKEQVD